MGRGSEEFNEIATCMEPYKKFLYSSWGLWGNSFFLPCQGTIGSAGPQGSKGDRGATVSVQKLPCQWAISESPLASTSKRGFIDRFFTWRHYIHFWCTKQWNGGHNFLLFRAICMVTDHESENNPYHKCKSPLASFSEWGWVQSCYHA